MPAAATLAAPAEQRRQASRPAGRAWNTLTDLAAAAPDNAVAALLLAAAPSVQNLSLHNQIALILQAGEQRLALRDIDTEQGWARRGRKPSQPGLQVTRPHYQASKIDGRCLFRTVYRFEFTQTEPLDNGVRTQTEPAAAGDPTAFAEHLTNQLDDRRYRVDLGAVTAVDHETQRVTIADLTWHHDPASAVRVLIVALAFALITGTDRDHDVLADRRSR